MLRRLVVVIILVIGVVVGCSQQAQNTELTSTPTSTASDNSGTTDQDLQIAPDQSSAGARQGGSAFVPLDNPDFLAVDEAGYLGDDELILGVEWADEARAYPLRMLRYHHIVNDTVDGKPFLITY